MTINMKFYPFELHTHTKHSDGNFTPAELIREAKKNGLTGVALTDHNTVSGYYETLSAAEKDGLILLKGIELTTFYGHVTVIGNGSDVDWRGFNPQTMKKLAENVKDSGGLIGIAHPFRIGYPICTGGSDNWGLSDYGCFTHYEVWSYLNPHKEPTNAMAEEKYIKLLERGYPLACVYGRDWHKNGTDGEAFAMTFLGIDGEVNAETAVEAVRRGRTYVSMGITAEFTVTDKDGGVFHIGERLPKGRYTFSCKADYYHDYKDRFGAELTDIKLKGSAFCGGIDVKCGESAELEIQTAKGFMLIEGYGNLKGERSKLLISSPFIFI